MQIRPGTRTLLASIAAGLLAAAAIPSSSAQMANVLTFHNDNARTGQNLSEGILTPQNVSSTTFGKLFNFAVDGKVDAQPLYAAAVLVSGHRHNLVIIATEHDSVYAIDADTGATYWQVSLVGVGETSSDTRNCSNVSPEIGITGTPVIDPAAGPHGTIYVVAMSKDSSSNYYQRVHALDLTTGAEQFGGPTTVQAAVTGTGEAVVFDPGQYMNRPGLLLVGGVVYTSWGSHCDHAPYAGWSMGYSEATLMQTSVLNFAPNGSEGAPWNSGGAPAADAQGNIYYSLGNGTFDTTLNAGGFPSGQDYGNSLVKLGAGAGALTVQDYWTMHNTVAESDKDTDLGSGGMVLLPDFTDRSGTTRQLVVFAGKDTNMYIADRNNMGKYDASSNITIYQELSTVLPKGVWSSPAYFNNSVYYGTVGNAIRSFPIANARFSAQPSSTTPDTFPYPGANPSISAYGTSNAILWAISNNASAGLYAYTAGNLGDKLYDSTQAANNRDQFGTGNKFIVPTIANGKVYAATTNSVAAFGLLPLTPAPIADGVYTLTNQKSGLVLDDPQFSPAAGTQLIQWTLNNGLNQSWFFASAGNGFYTIQNTLSGLYLTDTNGGGAGTPLQQQLRVGDTSQLWGLVVSGSGYAIQNQETSLVLTGTNNSAARGTGVTLSALETPASRSNQTWTIK